MAAGKNDRARERAEARRREIAERQAKEARKRLLLRIFLPLALVVVVVGVFVAIRATGGGGGADAAAGVVASGAAPQSLVEQVTTIPTASFDSAGVDGDVRAPEALADGQALTANGLPRVLYVGAEFCPFCAAERWVVVTSLARFGTFTDLGQTNSSPDDVHPNTATLSFSGATYASNYLAFTGYETSDVEKKPLDTLSTDDEALFKSLNPDGTIPFQDLGGKFTQNGSSFDPGLLADKTHAQIATAIADPTSDIGKAVLAASNLYTAALCELTNGQPGDVCTSSAVTAAAGKLGS